MRWATLGSGLRLRMLVCPGAIGSNIRPGVCNGQPTWRPAALDRRLTLSDSRSRINIGKSARSHEITGGATGELWQGVSCVRLLIAIPVYNERKYAPTVLDKVRRFHDGDILVVD